MTEDLELLIIPDVHSRDFWREAVDDVLNNTDKHIVFLGDYLDCYSFDRIEEGKEMNAFLDIIVLKRQFPDRITLLQGNHDLSYSVSLSICECRTDYENYDSIKGVFTTNKDNFDIAYETEINGKKFILSHAGLTKKWIERIRDRHESVDGSVRSLNEFFHTATSSDLVSMLGMVSWARGGWSDCASIVWASAFDDTYPDAMYGDAIQIVGHTQLNMPVKDGDKLYFIDAREPIYVNTNGDVLKYNSDEPIIDIATLKK